jgi:GNAT superfamily N-acetyltransferase
MNSEPCPCTAPSLPAPLVIRPMRPDDTAAVAALLRALARQFIVHEFLQAPASTFLRENDQASIARNLANGFVYHVADSDGVIAGFVGMRERQHLFHLFVGTPWQGRGVSRLLWDRARETALAAGGAPPFTVNASNYAVPAYERLGFVRSAPMQEKNGILFNPMQWTAAR